MEFPKSPRVVFGRHPIREVICQLRYPTILRIETEEPAAFQERIRSRYPLFEQGHPGLPANLPPAVAKLILGELGGASGGGRSYGFRSDDGVWKVSLTKDFLALATTKYLNWEDFTVRLVHAFDALREEYDPPFFLRLGLRYRDLICRSKLGLNGTPWAELIGPMIAAELADEKLGPGVVEAERKSTIVLPDDEGFVTIRHGLEALDKEQCFVFDSDFYTNERTGVEHAIEKLNTFNARSGSLFRYCITQRLHDALQPE